MPNGAGGTGGTATDVSDLALERDWDNLLREIEEGDVVPIIGQDVLTQEKNGHTVDANRTLAEDLAEVLRLRLDGDEAPSVPSVAASYLQRGGRSGELYETMTWLVDRAAKDPPPSPLVKLANIRPFRLFVTTNFDSWIEQALRAARPNRAVTSLAYEPGTHGADLPENHERESGAFVYHLLGRPGVGAFAVTEEDILEFMHQLLSPSSARRPDQLFDVLEKSHLLFLGCRFPDWLSRFFLRMARGVRLGDPHGRMNWIAGGTIEEEAGSGLDHFLTTSSERTRIFRNLSASQFIDELARRWHERHPVGTDEETVPEPAASERVFLSYTRADLPAVEALAKKLDEKNILYWFDKDRLDVGDRWEPEIKRNISGCCLFVALVSANVVNRDQGYVFKEWRWALDRQSMQKENGHFMLPVRLEGEPESLVTAPELPSGMQDLNWSSESQFLSRIVELYREKQRDRLDGRVVE